MGVLVRAVEWMIVRLTAQYDKLDTADALDWGPPPDTASHAGQAKVRGLKVSGVR